MKTILQNTEIAYNAISIQDAITILPIMDELRGRYDRLYQDYENAKNNAEVEFIDDIIDEAKIIYNQIQVLQNLGFVFSDNCIYVQPFWENNND